MRHPLFLLMRADRRDPLMSSQPSHPFDCQCGGCIVRDEEPADDAPPPSEEPKAKMAPPPQPSSKRVREAQVLEVWFDGSESTTITSSIELDHPAFTDRRF